jgi:hypothetical protein
MRLAVRAGHIHTGLGGNRVGVKVKASQNRQGKNIQQEKGSVHGHGGHLLELGDAMNRAGIMPTLFVYKILINQWFAVFCEDRSIANCNDGFLVQCKMHDAGKPGGEVIKNLTQTLSRRWIQRKVLMANYLQHPPISSLSCGRGLG